jgi:hypothetical protein
MPILVRLARLCFIEADGTAIKYLETIQSGYERAEDHIMG